MARAPRASVSMTSGQGISRLSYQKGRDLGNKGTQISRGAATPDLKREYSKKQKYPAGMNVSYGDTLMPTDLKDIKELGSLKPSKSSVSTATGKPKKLR